ncbi:MAG: hypothetical protein LBL35_02015 [Clostridiales bacterium]|jgi:hypothetical protein|nr:hypothetical protein [Clostridiales bacterium]
MGDEIKKLLGEEIKTEIQGLAYLDPGSEEKSTAIEDLVKLYKLRIEETKEVDIRESEERLKKSQLEEQVKDRRLRLAVEAAGILLPLMFYAVWMKRGFKFEETGTYTSTTFRGLFNRFKPAK